MSSPANTWSAVAKGWDAGHGWYARNVLPLTRWVCETVAAPGSRVLDVACGAGQPALAIAERVGPGGRVVATDLSPAMVNVVARRAREAGLDNLEAREMDAEELGFEDRSFDAVSSSFGLMFCPEPTRAVSQIRRVLVPKGRFAISVWGEPSTNPFFTIAARSIGAVVPTQPPDPSAPGPFRLGAPGELERVLRAGGLSAFNVAPREMTFEVESVDEYWRVFTAFAPGVEDRVARFSERERERARALIRAGVDEFTVGGRLRLPVMALCAAGEAP